MKTDYEAVKEAFAALKKAGYITRMASGKYACCGSCMAAEIAQKLTEKGLSTEEAKAVYFSRQSLQSFDNDGSLKDYGLFINWQGDAEEIIRALQAAGLKTKWEGTTYSTIVALPAMTREERRAAEADERAKAAKARDLAKRSAIETLTLELLNAANTLSASEIRTIANKITAESWGL